jgi:hypothetical protein
MPIPAHALLMAGGGSSGISSPLDVSGCLIWLDPSDSGTLSLDGNEIEAITNKGSVSAFDLSDEGDLVAGPNNQNTLNGHVVMDFVPNNVLFDDTTSLYADGSITLFFVVRADATSGTQVMYSEAGTGDTNAAYRFGVTTQAWWANLDDTSGASRFNLSTGDIVNGSYHICIFDDSSTLARLYLNHPTNIAATSGAYTRGTMPTMNRATLGANGRAALTLYFDGRIATMIAYNSVLNDADRTLVFNYLNSRFALGY